MLTGKNRIDGICFFGAPKEGATAVSNTQQIADAFRDARSWRRLFLVASLFTEGLGGAPKAPKCLPLPLSLEASNQQKRTLKGMCKKISPPEPPPPLLRSRKRKRRERERGIIFFRNDHSSGVDYRRRLRVTRQHRKVKTPDPASTAHFLEDGFPPPLPRSSFSLHEEVNKCRSEEGRKEEHNINNIPPPRRRRSGPFSFLPSPKSNTG